MVYRFRSRLRRVIAVRSLHHGSKPKAGKEPQNNAGERGHDFDGGLDDSLERGVHELGCVEGRQERHWPSEEEGVEGPLQRPENKRSQAELWLEVVAAPRAERGGHNAREPRSARLTEVYPQDLLRGCSHEQLLAPAINRQRADLPLNWKREGLARLLPRGTRPRLPRTATRRSLWPSIVYARPSAD